MTSYLSSPSLLLLKFNKVIYNDRRDVVWFRLKPVTLPHEEVKIKGCNFSVDRPILKQNTCKYVSNYLILRSMDTSLKPACLPIGDRPPLIRVPYVPFYN